jgi:hypothetical protein
MIPRKVNDLTKLKLLSYPTYTYGLDLVNKRCNFMIDGRAAMEQAIYKQLYTERFCYVIYSEHYGVEIDQYIGKNFGYIQTDAERVIKEALLADDRVVSVENFKITQTDIDDCLIEFTVNTNLGQIRIKDSRRFVQ